MDKNLLILDNDKPGYSLVMFLLNYTQRELEDEDNKLRTTWVEGAEQALGDVHKAVRETNHDYLSPKVIESLDCLASWHI